MMSLIYLSLELIIEAVGTYFCHEFTRIFTYFLTNLREFVTSYSKSKFVDHLFSELQI